MPVAEVIGKAYGTKNQFPQGTVLEVSEEELASFPDKLRLQEVKKVDAVSIERMTAAEIVKGLDSGALEAAYVLNEERSGKNRKTVIDAAAEMLE